MISELYLEGNNVDISADISSLLTFAIDDLKAFGERTSTFSKVVVLPGTAKNNGLFGNIFDTGHSNSYDPATSNVSTNFNASLAANCVIFQDNLQTFKGTMRMLKIIIDGGHVEYEVALNGEIFSLSVALATKYLTDLDFSAYDELYSVANIEASWDNVGGSGLYYPLMDYGTYSDLKHDWKYGTFRPAMYAKEYLDKIFAAANFRYDCALFNTSRFKKIIVPQNKKQLVKRSVNDLDVEITPPVTYTSNAIIPFPVHTTLGNFTPNVGSTEFTYTPSTPLAGTMYFKISGTYVKPATTGAFQLTLERNGSLLSFASITFIGLTSTAGSFDILAHTTATINQNDVIRVSLFFNSTTGSITFDEAHLYFSQGSISYVPISIGETIPVNDSIPQNIRQIDFLTSIVKLFNLYVYEDKFDDRLIKITPFVDFYSTDSANAVDWTYKMNRDKPQVIEPMSELNSRIYKFNFKDDSDYFNSEYKKRYNEGYGSYTFDSNYAFSSGVNTLEVIFSGTPLVGYQGEEKVYSTIFKRSGTTEESIDSNIRLLQTKKITGVSSWNILDGVSVLGSYTKYGYAGHLDDPDSPSNDLNFGVLKELYFTLLTGDLTVTQFNVYYSAYLAEITDKDSKLLTAKFYLTPKDIFELDFSKYVYIDGVLYRLMKITDYNTTTPADSECQLLKVINTLY